MEELSKLYNSTLRELVAAAPSNRHCQFVVASHSSLQPTSLEMSSALFGFPSARSTDGIPFRGNEGKKRHTSSIISALKTAGLVDWRVQGRRGAGSLENVSTYSQALGRSNQYEVLNF